MLPVARVGHDQATATLGRLLARYVQAAFGSSWRSAGSGPPPADRHVAAEVVDVGRTDDSA